MTEPAFAAYGERSRRFNETCGVFGYISRLGRTGANLHPDRCSCQGRDTTPHKHYPEPPFACARCNPCHAYEPHDEATKNALRRQAREIVEANCAA